MSSQTKRSKHIATGKELDMILKNQSRSKLFDSNQEIITNTIMGIIDNRESLPQDGT